MKTAWIHPDMKWFIGSLWDSFDESDLFLDERALVRNFAPRRQQEFIGCRYFTRKLLASLGVSGANILRGVRGEPIWPAGVVGSISHSGRSCFIVVARAVDVASVGVDIDTDEYLDQEILEQICTRDERERLGRATLREEDVCVSKLVFCAKESIFKCMYPLTGEYWDFDRVEVLVDPLDRTFAARANPGLSGPGRLVLKNLVGKYFVGGGYILCLSYLDGSGMA